MKENGPMPVGYEFLSGARGREIARRLNHEERAAKTAARQARKAARLKHRRDRADIRAWRREAWLAQHAPVTVRGLRATQFATVLSVVLFGGEMVLLTRVDDNLASAMALAVTLASTWGLVMFFSALADRGRRNLSAWRNYPPRMTPPTDV